MAVNTPSPVPAKLGGPAMQVVEFTTDQRFVRRARALRTIETMVRMYCRGQRHVDGETLCDDCAALLAYATRRLQRCVFGDAKPTCANCVVHCYKADMRERMRSVMRWAGPRMLLRHPLLAVAHLIEERRPAPMLPGRPARSRNAALAGEASGPTRPLQSPETGQSHHEGHVRQQGSTGSNV